MFRMLGGVIPGIAMLMALLAIAASSIGQGVHTEVVTIAASPVRYILSDDLIFRLVDLNRYVSAPISLPIHSIRDVMIAPDGQSALLLTRPPNPTGANFDFGLYYFHVPSGELRTVFHYSAAERPGESFYVTSIYNHFSPSFSPDGSRIALLDPENYRLYVYNLPDDTMTHLQDLQPHTNHLVLDWSPDGSQIAYRELDNAAIVINADGSNVRRYEHSASVPPVWSPDGRWLMLVRAGNEPLPRIRVVDPVTGEPHSYAGELEGLSPSWSCDGQWLSFFHSGEQMRLLNMETGETVNPHEESILRDVTLQDGRWLQDCSRMILREISEVSFNAPFDTAPLYLLDTQTMAVNLLTEDGLLAGVFENEVIYTTADQSARRTDFFRLNLDTWHTEHIGDIPTLNMWVRPLDRSRGLYPAPNTRQVMLLDFAHGTTRNLLPDGESWLNLVIWQTG